MSPSASDKLRERWWPPDDDGKPWRHLRTNFDLSIPDGIIRKLRADYQPTDEDYSALDFLCDEWDYGWEP